MRFVGGGLIVILLGVAGVGAGLLTPESLQATKVRYVRPGDLRVFPTPNLVFERSGLATEQERERLREQLVLPLINASEKPISVVVIEFYADEPLNLGVTVYWADGSWDSSLLTGTEPRFVNYARYRAEVEAFRDAVGCAD